MDIFEMDKMVMITDLSMCGGVECKWISLRWIR